MSSLLPELDPTLEIHTGVQSLVSGDSPFPIIRLACALLYLGGPQGSSTPGKTRFLFLCPVSQPALLFFQPRLMS